MIFFTAFRISGCIAAEFALVLIKISASVNWCWCGFKCNGQSVGLAIVSALICVIYFFVLVLMDSEGLSQLSFLSPAHSFFPSLGCSGYLHNAAITKQHSGQVRLVRLFTAFVS